MAVGVTQPSYQKWEAGRTKVPAGKIEALAKALTTTPAKLSGALQKFDMFGIDKSVSDDRKYYGEVAIHFASTSPPVLLPLSEAAREELQDSINGGCRFIKVWSLDNRLMFIRRDAVADIYFSSEAHDDYGPDSYGDHLGVHPDEDFWKIVEHLDCLECVEDEFESFRIEEVVARVSLSDENLDEFVAKGSVKFEEKEKVRKEAGDDCDRLMNRARSVVWQLSGGRLRNERISDNKALYKSFSLLAMSELDECGDFLYLSPEGYHRSIALRLSAIDYISVPAHKFNEGQIDSAEEELDEAP